MTFINREWPIVRTTCIECSGRLLRVDNYAVCENGCGKLLSIDPRLLKRLPVIVQSEFRDYMRK